MNYEDEREIDILSVIFFVLNKWRVLVIIALIGLLIGGAYKYISISSIDPDELDTLYPEDASVDSSIEVISDDDYNLQMSELESKVKTAESTLEILSESSKWQDKYLEESFLMQIDPYKKPQDTITYTFHAEGSSALYRDPADKMISRYSYYILNEENYREIAEKYNTDVYYIKELISFQTDLDANSITLCASGVDETMAGDILEIMKQELADAIRMESDNDGISIVITGTVEKYSEIIDQELITLQQNTRKTAMETANSINTQEKIKYQSEIEISELKKSKDTYDKAVDESYKELVNGQLSSNTPVGIKLKKSVKFAVIGFFVGLIIGIIWFAVLFMIKPVLRKDDEIVDYYGSAIIGSFSKPEKKSGIDRWLQKLEKIVTDRPDMVVLNNITLIIRTRLTEADKILFIGSLKEDDLCAIVEKLKLLLPDIELETANLLTGSTENLKKLIDIKDVIVVEEREASLISDIDKEIAIVREYDRNVVGFVTM